MIAVFSYLESYVLWGLELLFREALLTGRDCGDVRLPSLSLLNQDSSVRVDEAVARSVSDLRNWKRIRQEMNRFGLNLLEFKKYELTIDDLAQIRNTLVHKDGSMEKDIAGKLKKIEIEVEADGKFFPNNVFLGSLMAWCDEFSIWFDGNIKKERNRIRSKPI
ncbi:MAG TPA: hypothetical protein VFG32_00310 [Bacteroidota bacterium]|nr:hypothetical protein [Bacteroidota bacterium]